MATISQLKAWFSRGFIPTEAQYHAWIDSFFHKNEKVPANQIDGLQNLLDQKQDVGTQVPNNILALNSPGNIGQPTNYLLVAINEGIVPYTGAVYEVEVAFSGDNLTDDDITFDVQLDSVLTRFDYFPVQPTISCVAKLTLIRIEDNSWLISAVIVTNDNTASNFVAISQPINTAGATIALNISSNLSNTTIPYVFIKKV